MGDKCLYDADVEKALCLEQLFFMLQIICVIRVLNFIRVINHH